MKKWRRVLWVGVFCVYLSDAYAQQVKDSLSYLEGSPIEVGLYVTTNLVFHYKVRQVDRGTGALLAKLANDTVLLLKAANGHMPLTNLSVYTGDGKLHAFTVRFAAEPAHVWWREEGSVSSGREMTEDSLRYYSGKAMAIPGKHGARTRNYGLRWRLRGIYAHSNLLLLPLSLINHSAMDYDIGNIRFAIRDRQRAKRTATQERAVQPAYVYGCGDRVARDSQMVMVYVLPAFVLAGQRMLRIVLSEKNGTGRDLWIDINPRRLRHIRRL